MTTGATGQLGLALPVQGELSGTWGDTVNNGITQYTNIAIAGTLTLTGDGAVTLTNTTGDASASNITSSLTGAGTVTAQFAIVKIAGTLTTTKVVTFGSVSLAPYSKTFMVVNAATGGTVTFKAYGQTGVSIAVGESAWVYYNGTDIVKVSSTVASGVTTFSAGTTGLTPSSGTAGAVTLAGTLATANGGTNLTSFTSGGVVYASSTSALATGSALTFDGTNFATTGAGTFSGLLSRIHAQGTDAYITNTTTGKANTVMGFNDSGSTTAQGIPTGYAYYGTLQSYPIGFTSGGYLTNSISSTVHIWNTTGTEQMRLTSTGLGIGTNSPGYKLQVQGTASAVSGTAKAVVMIDDTTAFATGVGGAITFRGKYNTAGAYAAGAYIQAQKENATDGNDAFALAFGTRSNGSGAAEGMRITSAGNLAIGATTASNKLEVNGSARFYTAANGDVSITHSGLVSSITAAGSVSLAFGTNNTEKARISTAGGFSVGTTADPGAGAIYATGNITAYYSSDIKFKENVRDIPDALATVNAIGGKLFDWTDEYIESKGGADGYFVQKADFGVVAQDVQKVFPIAVRTREDGSLAVDYEKLGALAFAALVELTKRIEALEAK